MPPPTPLVEPHAFLAVMPRGAGQAASKAKAKAVTMKSEKTEEKEQVEKEKDKEEKPRVCRSSDCRGLWCADPRK